MQVDICVCGRQEHNTLFCASPHCKGRIHCQNFSCQNRSTWLCCEKGIKKRFLCKNCSLKNKNQMMDFFELRDHKGFMDFLRAHVDKVIGNGKLLQRIVQRQIREIILQLSSFLNQLNETLYINKGLETSVNTILSDKMLLYRYINYSFNYLNEKDSLQYNFKKITDDCKAQISDLHNLCHKKEVLARIKFDPFNNKNQVSLNDLNSEYVKLINEKQYTEALKICKEYLSIYPEDAQMLNKKGVCLHELGRYKKSEKYFKKIEKFNLVSNVIKDEFYTNYGHTLHKIKKYPEALKMFKEALGCQKVNYQTYLYLGNTLIKLKYYDEAIVAFSKLELQENNIPSKNLLNNDRIGFNEQKQNLYYRRKAKLVLKTYQTDDELEPIQKKLEELHQYNKNNIKIMFTLGYFYMQTIQFKKAKQILNDVYSIEPNHKKIGDCLMKLQQQIKQEDTRKESFKYFDCVMKCCYKGKRWFENTIQQ